jgi:RNA polymerase sigma-70 factor (ECF subfamily)
MNQFTNDSDNELINAYKAGDSAAFDKIVIRHMDRIVNLCYWLLGDYQDACDMAQEVFIKVFNALHGFRFHAAFSTWLYRITVNACKNKIRSVEYRFRQLKVSISDTPNGHGSIADYVDPELLPDVKLEEKQHNLLIKNAMNSLPSKQRVVVVLRDMEGLSYEEIGRVTGVTTGTVKSRLSRGRRALLRILRSK